MTSFFMAPAILFDRAIYPQWFGLSEDAFRLYIYLCSAAGNGTCYSGYAAAEKYVDLDKNRYSVAIDQLLNNKLVVDCGFREIGNRYTSLEDYKKDKPKCKTYGIAETPLIKYNNSSSGTELFIPDIELKDGKPLLFHTSNMPHRFIRIPHQFVYAMKGEDGSMPLGHVAQMSPKEIDCYFSLLFSNSEYWFGINLNYIRYEFPRSLLSLDNLEVIMRCASPKEIRGSELKVDQVLLKRTNLSELDLNGVLRSLIDKHQLFEWQFWIAQQTRYSEERRSKVISQLIPRYYLGNGQSAVQRLREYFKVSTPSKKANPHLIIGQLRSRLKLDPAFEKILQINCDRLSRPENMPKVRNF